MGNDYIFTIDTTDKDSYTIPGMSTTWIKDSSGLLTTTSLDTGVISSKPMPVIAAVRSGGTSLDGANTPTENARELFEQCEQWVNVISDGAPTWYDDVTPQDIHSLINLVRAKTLETIMRHLPEVGSVVNILRDGDLADGSLMLELFSTAHITETGKWKIPAEHLEFESITPATGGADREPDVTIRIGAGWWQNEKGELYKYGGSSIGWVDVTAKEAAELDKLALAGEMEYLGDA